jgi:PhnB protein
MPDPFDALRRPSGPVAPRPVFAAALRRRLEGALHDLLPTDVAPLPDADPARSTVDLGERKDTAMSQTTGATTPTETRDPLAGATRMRPYLVAAGAADAIAFYQEAFGAVVDLRLMQPDGRVGHAELRIGDGAAFAIADEFPEYEFFGPTTRGGTTVSLTVDVPDVDALFARAVAAGATAEREPMDEFYGARAATLRDPWGHRWHLHHQLEDLTAEEMQRRLDAQGDA